MKPLIFNFETSNGVELRVWVEMYAEGSYDEPQLGLDGDPLIELIHTPTVPEFVVVTPARVEKSASGMDIHYSKVEAVNPEWRSTKIPMEDLTPGDRARLENMIESLMDDYLRDHFCEISQDMAERAADSLYESWKDGE